MRRPCNQSQLAAGLGLKGNSRMTSTSMCSTAETEMPLSAVARFRKAR
jgi:hypothetical protein